MIIQCSVTIRKWDVGRTVCDYTLSETFFFTVGEWRFLTNDTCNVASSLQFSFISKPIMNTFHNIWLTSSTLEIGYPHWTADQTINTVL